MANARHMRIPGHMHDHQAATRSGDLPLHSHHDRSSQEEDQKTRHIQSDAKTKELAVRKSSLHLVGTGQGSAGAGMAFPVGAGPGGGGATPTRLPLGPPLAPTVAMP
jgi:hypothetical protein